MKIAYVFGGNFSQHPGLVKKIYESAGEWLERGHDVLLISYGEYRTLDPRNKLESVLIKPKSSFRRLRLLIEYFFQYKYLKVEVEKFNPDIVYGRYAFPLWSPEKGYGATSPYVLEINSDDLVEYGLKSSLTGFINRLFRKSFISNSAGLVFVTNDLSSSRSFSFFKKNIKVIANGVIDAGYEIGDQEVASEAINVGFVGSPNQSWHGVDKVVKLAKLLPTVNFHIVGVAEDELDKIVNVDTKLENIKFYGYLKGTELLNQMKKWDVGVSSLALHRKNMEEACPLKSRQYLSLGIPMVYAYDDPDMTGDEPFCLKLPNVEGNVEHCLEEISRFFFMANNDLNMKQMAMNFSRDSLSVSKKERLRLEFFKEVVLDEKR